MKIFCSGIGGIGLSAYASLQKLAGHEVHGSDRSRSALLDDLESQGIVVGTEQDGSLIPEGCDLLVYSEAIPPEAPERVKAVEKGIAQMSYPQAVGELTRGKTLIAVCGTHGKSSTTGMCARLLIETGKDPTVVVGTKLRELNGRNWRQGSSDLFLLEACEYRRSFRFYHPAVVLMTNVDGDHFDYYESPDDYRSAFSDFISALPENGALVTHLEDADCKALAEKSGKRVVDGDRLPLIPLQTPGVHMQQNAQLALGLADVLGIPQADAQKAVSGYAGSWRRLEVKGTTKDGVTVIDDYAHHPKEIRATVDAIVTAYKPRRIVAVFQPHTHDRTLKLYKEFLGAFRGLDLVFVTDVYEARKEAVRYKANVRRMVGDIGNESGVAAGWTGDLSSTEVALRKELKSGDVLLVMGAGDVTKLAGTMAGAS